MGNKELKPIIYSEPIKGSESSNASPIYWSTRYKEEETNFTSSDHTVPSYSPF